MKSCRWGKRRVLPGARGYAPSRENKFLGDLLHTPLDPHVVAHFNVLDEFAEFHDDACALHTTSLSQLLLFVRCSSDTKKV